MKLYKKIWPILLIFLVLISCNSRDVSKVKIDVPVCKVSGCIASSVKNNVFIIKQTLPNNCWAAVLSMMYSWKNQHFTKEETILQPYPYFTKVYENAKKEGITVKDELLLYNKLGLSVEKQLNPTIKGWVEMIEQFGPLSITIDANPPFGTIHAILILGIQGLDTGLQTTIWYADPADGQLHTQNFLDFLKMYESKYSVDWEIQIIHFKSI